MLTGTKGSRSAAWPPRTPLCSTRRFPKQDEGEIPQGMVMSFPQARCLEEKCTDVEELKLLGITVRIVIMTKLEVEMNS